jgi:hypothetical protein
MTGPAGPANDSAPAAVLKFHPMYDGLTLCSYISRWRPLLEGAKVIDALILDAVDLATNTELEDELRAGAAVVLVLSGGGEERELVFVNPGTRSGVFLWKRAGLRWAKPRSVRRKQEAGFLKRRLAGAVVGEVRQHGRDRLLRMDLRGSDELGDPASLALHFSLTGRRANLVLEAEPGVIYAWRSGPRYGEPFQPLSGGLGTVGEYIAARRSGEITPRRKRSLAGELVLGVDGVSSTAVTELFRRLSLAPDVVFDQLDAEALDLLAAEGDRLIASADEVRFYPAAGVVSSLPLLGLGDSRPATEEDESAVVARFEREHRRALLAVRLRGELDRITGRRRKADRDKADALDKAAGADDLMHAGQMLLTSNNVRSAAPASITLPEGRAVPLDPEASRLVNAQRLFERSKRNRRSLEHADMLDDLIASLDAEYDELAAALAPDAPLGILTDLHARYLESERPTEKGGRALPAKVGHRELPGGFTLYWGRDGHANQYVTFRLARPGDVWFHVQQGSGAHVVVRRPDRDTPLPFAVIEEAAGLALKNSSMRTAAHVPVVYTERRYVRHRRGAPGSVFYEREKVIYMDGGT